LILSFKFGFFMQIRQTPRRKMPYEIDNGELVNMRPLPRQILRHPEAANPLTANGCVRQNRFPVIAAGAAVTGSWFMVQCTVFGRLKRRILPFCRENFLRTRQNP